VFGTIAAESRRLINETYTAGCRRSTSTSWWTPDAHPTRERSPFSGFTVGSWYWQMLARSGFVDPDVKLKDYSPAQWDDFLYKPATKIKQGTFNVTYEGLVVKVQRLHLAKDRESLSGAPTPSRCHLAARR
jgi:hypothetical protein